MSGQAFVLAGDSGVGGMTQWTSLVRLFVFWAGQPGVRVTHECQVDRGKELVSGMTVPVTADPADPSGLSIRWDEVPTILDRIAARDPVIVDPVGTWHKLYTADPNRHAPIPPDLWSQQSISGWPPADPLKHGRLAATAWVVDSSADPKTFEMRGPNFRDDGRVRMDYKGETSYGPHRYRAWLLLCVRPPVGEPYGAYFRTDVVRARFMPVLPISINPADASDIEIEWDHAPSILGLVAERIETSRTELKQRAAAMSGLQQNATVLALSQIADPAVRAQAAATMAKAGVTVDMAAVEAAAATATSATPVFVSSGNALARLEKLHASGILTDAEFATERSRIATDS